MKKETVSIIEFVAPGSFVAETWRVASTETDPARVEFPENAYAFRMYEREDVVDDGVRYKGIEKQIGPLWYHPHSHIQGIEEVRKDPRATSTLIQNMEINKWPEIIWTRWGNWPQPFDAKTMRVVGR